jgi:hypothetical protein
MAVTKDWLPWARRGIPGTALTELTARRNTARTALETATKETTRTPIANALCKEAAIHTNLDGGKDRKGFFL